ncbi:unnamed protein product [Dibothriocephalus latus]|uniref:Rab-GAP TBC domain-containing protein n=1 Tax=Dibothriocephalus latus TaxID=60516 RepID=A0A3P7PM06_DIBLA|nr:unnamed protein product [Dibothriocephalus latus]
MPPPRNPKADQLPDVAKAFEDVGIEAHMFASQWLLTLFTAKFPLNLVFHILDVFLCEVSLMRLSVHPPPASFFLRSHLSSFVFLFFYWKQALPRQRFSQLPSHDTCAHCRPVVKANALNTCKR